ncbi:MAG TPA: pyrroline-5-carboxylate reductase [Bdellovibrionota bacterium]|nr:pyrroline-5-carboxylate reductase [Bdellovibrionota bacterium]
MLKQKKIGIIGSGNMARALVSGLLNGNHASKSNICSSDHRETKVRTLAKEFGIFTTTDNSEVVTRSDIIVLAVKPQALEKVLREVGAKVTSKKLVVSMAAGVPIESIEKKLPKGSRIVRVMPNVAALVGAGAAALAVGEHASEEDLALARALFEAVGITVVVEEVQLDAVTGLSGSGPAYIFLVIESLADAGVKVGLSRDIALSLAAQTVLGAAKLLIETGEHPGRLKDMVTSPGGTAIAGIHTLEEGGLRTTLINAVERATIRSRELGALFNVK